ncbi:hypothetical protein DSECCO2_544340 [anaerobic digester metagenome]
MQIAYNQLWFEAEKFFISFKTFAVKCVGLHIFQVADMLAQYGLIVFADGKAIHQFGSGGQNAIDIQFQIDRCRRISARAAAYTFFVIHNGHHRIIGAVVNITVVSNYCIGNFCENIQCI